jgi:serine/threonine protein kinase
LLILTASIYDPSQTVSPDGYIKAAGTEIARAKQRFEIAVDNAKKEAARAQLNPPGPHFKRQTRQASLPNVFEDQDEHPTDTSVRFIYIQSLGQSSTAIVDEVKEVSSGETFARKSVHIHYQKDAQQLEADMKNEYKIMKRLRHVHIAEVLFHVKNAEACMVFMLPVADRNLQSFLEACIDKCFPEADTESIYSWFSCLISALAYAHEQRIRHRDIKPTNILVKDGRPYLADFGVSKDFTEAGTSSSYANTVFGTPVYRAPEISPKAERGRAADVFSMGCVFSEMLTVCMRKSLEEFRTYRKGPITSLGDHAFRENLAKVNEWLWELRGDKRTNVLVDQIAKMIYADPQKRRKARETVELLRTDGGLFCTCTS